MQSPLLTIREAARLLNVSYNTIRNAITSGRLLAFRFGKRGGTYRIDPGALESYKAACATGTDLKPSHLATTDSRTTGKGKKFECLDGARLAAAWLKQGVASMAAPDLPKAAAEPTR
jgi:excisionase family DNA binding protein